MKKGFTLIELLAVIVILAIIALIATPIVLNIINDTKESAILRSAEFYMDAVELSIAQSILNGQTIQDEEYIINEDGNICLNETCTEIIEVEVNGEKPKGEYITFADGKVTELVLDISSKTVVYNPETGKFAIHEGILWTTPSDDCFEINTEFNAISNYTCDYENIIIPNTINGTSVKLGSLSSDKVIRIKINSDDVEFTGGFYAPNLKLVVNASDISVNWAFWFEPDEFTSESTYFKYGHVFLPSGKEVDIVGPNGEKGDTYFFGGTIDGITYRKSTTHNGFDIIGATGVSGDVVIPKTIGGMEIVGITMDNGGFSGSSATTITLPETLEYIDTENPVFSGSVNLTRIVNTSGLTANWAFLTFPNELTAAANGFKYGRIECDDRTIDIVGPDGETGYTYNCHSIVKDGVTYTESNYIETGVSSSGGLVINGYTGTNKNLVIPNEINGIPVVGIGQGGLGGYGLTSVTLPNTLEYITQSGLTNNNLTEIIIPASVTNLSDGEMPIFQGNPNLTSIVNNACLSVDWYFLVDPDASQGYNESRKAISGTFGNVVVTAPNCS